MTSLSRYLPLVGRGMMSLLFIGIGIGKITGWQGTAEYIASKHLVGVPLLLALSIAVELAGGASLLLGWKARVGALGLLAYLVPVTLMFHDYWALTGMAAQIELLNFLKNVAIMGGLGLIVAFGPGPISVDSWLRRRRAP